MNALAQLGQQAAHAAHGKNALAELAQVLRAIGEQNSAGGQDTILAHINPAEAATLKAMGGSGRIDPITGALHFDDSGDGVGSDNSPSGERDTPGSGTSMGDMGSGYGTDANGNLGGGIDRNSSVALSPDSLPDYSFNSFSPAQHDIANVSFDQSPLAFDTPFGKVTQQDLALSAMTAFSPLSPGVMAAMSAGARSLGDGITGALESAFGVAASSPPGSVSYGPANSTASGGGVSVGGIRQGQNALATMAQGGAAPIWLGSMQR